MQKKIATIPKVVESPGAWYVYFEVINPFTGKMVPVKKYKGFKSCKTIAEKRAWGKKLVDEYTAKLKTGWTPVYDTDKIVYTDQVEYKLLSSQYKRIKSTVRNSRFYINEFVSWKCKSLTKKTQETYVSKLRIFCEWIEANGFKDYDVSAIDNNIVLSFFTSINHLDKVTVIKYRQIISDYFKWLKSKGLIIANPVFNILIPPKTKDCAARPIPPADMKALLTLIENEDPQLFVAIMFEYYCAIRPGNEMLNLKVKDVDLYNKLIVITADTAKEERRTIDLPDAMSDILRKYNILNFDREFYIFGRSRCPGILRLGQNTLRNRFNVFRDKLKLPDIYKLYSSKHTGAGRLLENGFTIEMIKEHMDHKSLESTQHYVRRHFGNRNQQIINDYPDPY